MNTQPRDHLILNIEKLLLKAPSHISKLARDFYVACDDIKKQHDVLLSNVNKSIILQEPYVFFVQVGTCGVCMK